MDWPSPLDDDGTLIDSAQRWQQRRPNLRRQFQHWVYGPWAALPDTLAAQPLTEPCLIFDGAATLREFAVVTTGPDTAFSLLIITPNHVDGPAPTFLGANFFGNHRVVDHPAVAVSHTVVGSGGQRPSNGERGADAAAWDVERTVAAGYAFATFCMSEVVPDDAELARGPLATFAGSQGRTGALSAWGWAFSRCLDLLAGLPAIDSERVAAVGHSRLGKAALWATAMDDRIAAVISSQSGCGGAAPSRTAPALTVVQDDGRPIAETVEQITSRFPHWFAAKYTEMASQVADLPIEQDALVALCAPRPVLLPNAVDDHWADPAGQFDVLRGADPVYRLLGVTGLETDSQPAEGQQSLGRLGYSLRSGGHSMTAEDWLSWRAFADRWVRDPAR